MSNTLMKVAIAAVLCVGGIANANARMTAEQATKVMQETAAGRRFAEILGVKLPKGEVAVRSSQENLAAVEAALKNNPKAAGVLAEIATATAGKTGAAADAAGFKVLNTNTYSAELIKVSAASSGNAVDKLLGGKGVPVAQQAEGTKCEEENSVLIPAKAKSAGLNGILCGSALAPAQQARLIQIFEEMGSNNDERAAKNAVYWRTEAGELVKILARDNPLGLSAAAEINQAALEGAKTLCAVGRKGCGDCAPGLKAEIGRL